MKTTTGILIAFVLLVLSACDQKIENSKISNINLFCVHEITLKPGADEKAFEALVTDEIAPLYRKLEGQDLFLTKGYVGIRADQYAIFITFRTVEERNNIYPLSGGFSKEFHEATGVDSIWNKFNSMATGFDGLHVTDYVRVNHLDKE